MRRALTHWFHHPKLASRQRSDCQVKPAAFSVQHEAGTLMERARLDAIGEGRPPPQYPFSNREVVAIDRRSALPILILKDGSRYSIDGRYLPNRISD